MHPTNPVNCPTHAYMASHTVVCSKQLIECLSKNVDHKRMGVLATQMEYPQCCQHLAVVCQFGDWSQKFPPDHNIAQSYTHSTSSKRVSHVEGIAKDKNTRTFNGTGREEAVWHAAHSSILHTVLKGALYVLWNSHQVLTQQNVISSRKGWSQTNKTDVNTNL